MGIDVPTILDALLEATADEATAKARIASLRASLEEESLRRFITERAAPSWNAPDLGKVRFDPPGKWEAMVADHDAFGSWVAEHHPSEATGVIRLPAALLEEALMAIGFALGEYGQPNTVTSSVEVRPAWSSTFLGKLAVDVEETPPTATLGDGEHEVNDGPNRTFTITDPDTGELVDGVTGTRSAAKLVVSLDRDRRTQAIESARSAATALLEVAQTDERPEVDREELDERRRYLEGLHADVLAAYAGRLELSKSGTKAELAERIARTEAITGRREIVPASAVEGPHGNATTMTLGEALAVQELVKGLEDGARQSAAEETAAIIDGRSREQLRAFAKAKGLSAAGTKPQVITRIVDAGHTARDVDAYLAQETTP